MRWLRLGGDPAVRRHSAISRQQHRLLIELAELFDLFFLSLPSRWPDITVRRSTAMNTYELLTLGSVVVVVVLEWWWSSIIEAFYLALLFSVPEAGRTGTPNQLAESGYSSHCRRTREPPRLKTCGLRGARGRRRLLGQNRPLFCPTKKREKAGKRLTAPNRGTGLGDSSADTTGKSQTDDPQHEVGFAIHPCVHRRVHSRL